MLPPSVNRSEAGFTPENGNIRFGLMAVKNLGAGIIDKLVSERNQNGEYTSMYDFCYRNYSREFNRKALEGLIKSGAMDGLEANRRQMLYNTDGVIEAVVHKDLPIYALQWHPERMRGPFAKPGTADGDLVFQAFLSLCKS